MSERKTPVIGIGYRVGKLIVEEATEKRKGGYRIWRCRCDCGGSIELDTRCLQRGTVRDCGCQTRVKPGQRDITGMRFGMLVAVAPAGDCGRNGSRIWHCKCDCGGEVDAPLNQLTSGYRKSCGCLRHPQLKDFVGKRFGMLTVIEYAGKWDGMHRWRCRCDCGKESIVGQTLLQSGKTKSCGCLQNQIVYDNMRFVEGTSVAKLEKADIRRISSNTSGVNGVYQNRRNGKWNAQITFKGKTYYLGSYGKIEDAAKARKQAEEHLYGGFLDWYYHVYQ